ncbi:MAG: hypothetical protein NT169_04540 [Chloroflexi bacterium]|nr:hypothetical protein [Chloroflexota bacterium]
MNSQMASLPPVSHGVVVREKLPFPVVYYPNRHGAFFAFARTAHATPVLCACSRRAVENLLRLAPDLCAVAVYDGAARTYFPDAIAWKIAAWSGRGAFPVKFVPGVCHRCNKAVPTLPDCNDSCGDTFTQSYGWYVNLAYLELGMMPQGQVFLSEDCPFDYRADLEAVRSIEQAFQQECARLLEASYGAGRNGVRANGQARLPGISGLETARMTELRHQASSMRRDFKVKIENLVRREIGAYA